MAAVRPQGSSREIRLCACALVLASLAASRPGALRAQAGEAPSAAADSQMRFELPAGPLAKALDAYCAATGVEALYDTDLVQDRRTDGVVGVFDRREALERLLAGTGLAARFTSSSNAAFVLYPVRGAVISGPPPAPAASSIRLATLHVEAPEQLGGPSGHGVYARIVQNRIQHALQRDEAVRQRSYSADVRIEVLDTGVLSRPVIFRSTGDEALDRRIVETLNGLDVGPPPVDLPQPMHVRLAAHVRAEG